MEASLPSRAFDPGWLSDLATVPRAFLATCIQARQHGPSKSAWRNTQSCAWHVSSRVLARLCKGGWQVGVLLLHAHPRHRRHHRKRDLRSLGPAHGHALSPVSLSCSAALPCLHQHAGFSTHSIPPSGRGEGAGRVVCQRLC